MIYAGNKVYNFPIKPQTFLSEKSYIFISLYIVSLLRLQGFVRVI